MSTMKIIMMIIIHHKECLLVLRWIHQIVIKMHGALNAVIHTLSQQIGSKVVLDLLIVGICVACINTSQQSGRILQQELGKSSLTSGLLLGAILINN